MSRPTPEVTRVGGGGSARIAAVVVAAALVAIVWVGVSERPKPGPISAVAPSASTTTAPVAPGPSDAPPSPATPAPSTAAGVQPRTAEAYGASLYVGNVRYATVLSELEPGHFTGELHFPSPRRPTGTFAFTKLWSDAQVDAAVAIGEWPVDLQAVAGATRTPANVVNATFPRQQALWEAPAPVSRGYQIVVSGSNDLLFSQLQIDVRIGNGEAGDAGTGDSGTGDGDSAASKVRFGVEIREGDVRHAVILSPRANGSFWGRIELPRPRRAEPSTLRLYNVQLTVSHDIWTEIDGFDFELTPEMAKVGVSKFILNQATDRYRLVARTSGNVGGQSINLTVIARRVSASE